MEKPESVIELIDTHAHLSGEEYDSDRKPVLERAHAAGVAAVIDFGTSMDSSERAVDLAKNEAMVFAGVGIHPNDAYPMTASDDERLIQLAQEVCVVAIGEIGLDYHWEKDSDKRALQREIFIRQLDLARQVHLPVCIHDRDAHGDTLAILKKEGRQNVGVIHCFSGSLEMARELWKLGWYLGVDGPVTYKNAAKAPEIVRAIPAEKLLLETDCPYLSPMPYRGKRNEPAFIRKTADFVAEIRGESVEQLSHQTTSNARCLYGRLK